MVTEASKHIREESTGFLRVFAYDEETTGTVYPWSFEAFERPEEVYDVDRVEVWYSRPERVWYVYPASGWRQVAQGIPASSRAEAWRIRAALLDVMGIEKEEK